MAHCKIMTELVFSEELEGTTPKLMVDFPNLGSLSDLIEFQGVPNPNINVGYLNNASPRDLELIRNDPRYDGAILLTNDNEADIPTQQEFDLIRGFLLTKLTENPPTSDQVDEAIGTTPSGRTRWHICEALIQYIKALPA